MFLFYIFIFQILRCAQDDSVALCVQDPHVAALLRMTEKHLSVKILRYAQDDSEALRMTMALCVQDPSLRSG